MSTVKEVIAFYDGLSMGLRMYGTQYVGTSGRTLEEALEDIKEGKRIDLAKAVADREEEIDFIMTVIDGCDGDGLVQTEDYDYLRERVAEFFPVLEPPLPAPWNLPLQEGPDKWALGDNTFEGWSGQDTANWQAEERAADAHLEANYDNDQGIE